ncbi:MAG: hypothetical protein RLZZ618_1836 [Pseudomonadota bacterium]
MTATRGVSPEVRTWLWTGFVLLVVLTFVLLEVPVPVPTFSRQGVGVLLLKLPVVWPWSIFARCAAVALLWVLFLFFGQSAAAADLRGERTRMADGPRRRNQLLGWVLASAAAVFCVGFIARMSFLHF